MVLCLMLYSCASLIFDMVARNRYGGICKCYLHVPVFIVHIHVVLYTLKLMCPKLLNAGCSRVVRVCTCICTVRNNLVSLGDFNQLAKEK